MFSPTLIILGILSILLWTSCSTLRIPTYKGEITDHFNGRKFYNPGSHQLGDFKELFNYNRTHKRGKWTFQNLSTAYEEKVSPFKTSGKIRYAHINHATVLIQVDGVNILTDPVYSKRASPYAFIGPKRYRHPGIPFEMLPEIDLVLISHDHYDHLDVATLKRLHKRDQPLILTGLGLKGFLKKFDLDNVKEMDWHESLSHNGLEIFFTPAVHWSNRGFSPGKSLWGSYYIRGSASVYFAGDTAYSDHFINIRETYGSPDLALLPIGAFIPRSFMLHVHMDPQQAVQAHKDLAAGESLAIHWGTFRLSHESMEQPAEELYAECASLGINNFHADVTGGKMMITKSN